MTFLERIKAAPPGRQAALAGLVLVVVCAALFAVYFLLLKKDYEVLFRDLRTADAATIVAELDKTKVPYRLSEGGTTILVPENLVDATRLSVMSQDLPLRGAVGFELFNKSDMGLTEFAQRINYQRALQGELARTLMTMDGIETARIHLTITEPTVFRADRKPPKASVTVVPRTGHVLGAQTVRGIQRLVAASVPDLDVANVVILDGEGQIVSGAEPAADPATPEVQQRQAIELYYAARVREAMAPLYPQGGVEVTVIADPAPDALAAPADANPDTAAEPASPLNASARRFRLRVAVMAPPPLDPQKQEELRLAAAGAIGESASGQADVISVFTSDATWAQPQAADPIAATVADLPADSSPVAPSGSPRGFWVSALLATLLVLGLLAFFIHRRRTAAPGLSEDERQAYAQRLKDLLSEGEAHAAPPV